jgi:hypothetical protein
MQSPAVCRGNLVLRSGFLEVFVPEILLFKTRQALQIPPVPQPR